MEIEKDVDVENSNENEAIHADIAVLDDADATMRMGTDGEREDRTMVEVKMEIEKAVDVENSNENEAILADIAVLDDSDATMRMGTDGEREEKTTEEVKMEIEKDVDVGNSKGNEAIHADIAVLDDADVTMSRDIHIRRGERMTVMVHVETLKKMIMGLSSVLEDTDKTTSIEIDNGMEEETMAKKLEMETLKTAAVKYSEDNIVQLEVMQSETNQKTFECEEDAVSAVRTDRMRVDNLATIKVVAVAQLCFTVDRWAERIKRGGLTVGSPKFYSHDNGYNMQLKVNPGGRSSGRGTHLSVYSLVCKGEYDAVLPWPCRYSVTVSVVNQRTKEPHTTGTNICCSINNSAFSRPIDADNPPYGWHSFVSHVDLQSTEGLVVNDSVLLLVVVAPPPVNVLSFPVDRFSAGRAANKIVRSPHFYSHANGYKLRLEMYPGGRGDGRGTHFLVSSVVCRGENDDKLVWPCRYGIALSVLNQHTNEAHVTETNTHCSIYQLSFNKPMDTDHVLGRDTFISHADLDSTEGLIVNDSVLLRVALIPPQ